LFAAAADEEITTFHIRQNLLEERARDIDAKRNFGYRQWYRPAMSGKADHRLQGIPSQMIRNVFLLFIALIFRHCPISVPQLRIRNLTTNMSGDYDFMF
jgi:hypothetical protein